MSVSNHKAGFVNIIGLPNVGKSTLLNALVGEKLSIISPKAQTTRHRILGIVDEEDFQLVFSDSPGYINQPAYKLQSAMNESVDESLDDADVLLFVTDKFQKDEEQTHLVDLLLKTKAPVIVLINKLDLCSVPEAEALVNRWKEKIPAAAHVLAISVTSGINAKKLIHKIVELLPLSPPYYEKGQLSDRNQRFFVAESVREQIFTHYSAEIPYSCQVEIEKYEEGEKLDRIKCIIFVERDSQKAILIGQKGAALKTVGVEARKQIEKFLGKQIYLELTVKVREKWRNDEKALKNFGYINK